MEAWTDEPETPPTRAQLLRAKLNYFWYWNINRRAGRIGRWIIWKLPKRVVYWCVIRAAVAAEPDKNPGSVTAEAMLKKFDYNKKD